MRLTKEELTELYLKRTARSARERGDCPVEAMFVRAATKELNRQEREQFADHLSACSDCAGEYRLIQSLKSEMEPGAAPRKGLAAASALWEKIVWAPGWRAAAAVTAIAIVIGAVTLPRLAQPGREPAPQERGDASLTVKVEPPNLSVLREPPERLVWPETKSAESYQVVLYDFESTPIWESPMVKETAIRLPDDVRSRLPRGKAVYWRVISIGGVDRRQSELFQFTISP